jgi:hypothetical protein
VPTDQDRKLIDEWIAVAPDTRVVESTQAGDRWTTQAIEDGEVRYEETQFEADVPEMRLLARWCERQAKQVEPRPPVKVAPVIDRLERKRQG